MIDQKEKKIDGKYTILSQIGRGSFGTIHLVSVSNSEVYAAKFEDVKCKAPQLMHEAKVTKDIQGGIGIPNIHWHGREDTNNIMIIDFLGPNLEDLFNMCERRFSVKTVIMLGDQILQRIEYLHSKNYIHRDIKPDNFVMGLGRRSAVLYIIDFGLSKKYRNSKTHEHINYRENKTLTGTARYASINSHLGVEQSRRDDLEAIGYVMVYFLRGYLPWQGIRANSKLEKYHKIMEKKMSTPAEVLCKNLPIEFSTYIDYCRALKFEEKADYAYLRRLLKDVFLQYGYEWDYVYDWCLPIKGEKTKKYHNKDVSISTNIQDFYHNECKPPITLHINETVEQPKNISLTIFQDFTQQNSASPNTVTTNNQHHHHEAHNSMERRSSSNQKSSKKSTLLNQEILALKTIYERIGGAVAIQIAVERLYQQLAVDPRVMHFFRNTDLKRQVQRQKEFLTTVLGGPDIYQGRNMRDAHLNMGLQDMHFDVVVNTLAAILLDLGVDQSIINEIAAVCETIRDDVLCR